MSWSKVSKEVSTAARSLRSLTDYLERNPRALIFGKSDSKENSCIALCTEVFRISVQARSAGFSKTESRCPESLRSRCSRVVMTGGR